MTTGYAIITQDKDKKELLKIFADNQITDVVIEQGGSRGKLKKLIDKMKHGDDLVITEVENICNNSRELIFLIGKLNKNNINLYSLNETWIDTRQSACNELLINLFNFEMMLIKARRKVNIDIPFGKRPGRQAGTINKEKALKAYEYHKKGYKGHKICELVGISRATLYKYLRYVKEKKS